MHWALMEDSLFDRCLVAKFIATGEFGQLFM